MLEVVGLMLIAFGLLVVAGIFWRCWFAENPRDGYFFLIASIASLLGFFFLLAAVLNTAALPNGKALATLPLGKQQVVCVAEDGENLLLVGTGVEVTRTGGREVIPFFYAVPASAFVSRTACRGETLAIAVADEGGKNRIIRILQ